MFLQEIFIQFPNAITPDTDSVLSSLKEYAVKTSDGMWRLAPKVVERESEHTKMIYMLAMLGKKCGYSIWIGKKEQAEIYQGKKLADLCDFDSEPKRSVTTMFILLNQVFLNTKRISISHL